MTMSNFDPRKIKIQKLNTVPMMSQVVVLISLSTVASLPFGEAQSRQFTSCAPGSYGKDCSGVCKCADTKIFDCHDGITGDGRCSCRPGFERECGGKWIVTSPRCPENRKGSLACAKLDQSFYNLPNLPWDANTNRKVR